MKVEVQEKINKKELPIGFMDSGLGGLSVLKEAIKILPSEDFIYYGDSKNAPYGTKTQDEIRKLTLDIVEKLVDQGIKGLVVACNTATSAAIKILREKYPDMPVLGIEPAIKPAVIHSHGGKILVLATPMTIKQQKFHILLDQYKDQANIIPVSCEGLMEFVEEGNIFGHDLDEYFENHLSPYLDHVETIVLGCTHYPFLRPHLKKYLNSSSIKIIDGSLGTALELKRQLYKNDLLREHHKGHITIYNSTEKEDMMNLSYQLLNMNIE